MNSKGIDSNRKIGFLATMKWLSVSFKSSGGLWTSSSWMDSSWAVNSIKGHVCFNKLEIPYGETICLRETRIGIFLDWTLSSPYIVGLLLVRLLWIERLVKRMFGHFMAVEKFLLQETANTEGTFCPDDTQCHHSVWFGCPCISELWECHSLRSINYSSMDGNFWLAEWRWFFWCAKSSIVQIRSFSGL